jgi:hypothetical protein
MTSGEIYNNVATGLTSYGGNVYVAGEYKDENTTVDAAEFYIEGGLLSGDGETKQAMNGGGIANLGMCAIMFGEIRNCVADFGSGVYNLGTFYSVYAKISSTNTTSSIGKAIANLGLIHLGPTVIKGVNMDIAMGCTKTNGEIVDYSKTNIFVKYNEEFEEVIEKLFNETDYEPQYKLTFATLDNNSKEMEYSNDFPNYHIANSLPIITYNEYEGEPFEVDVNYFISDEYNIVVTDDGSGLKLVEK